MADKVQLILEAMLPELEALSIMGYFTKSQIKNIIKKRRTHEYGFVKKVVSKEDFLKAIRFEKIMDKRKEKIKKEKNIKDKNEGIESHCK